jgi:alpha-tubulin suppressor-like RCC1 family protein
MIYAGATHSLALKSNDVAYGWGEQSSGQIGDNTILTRYTPVEISKRFTYLSGGWQASYGVDDSSVVWSWGNNSRGQIGDFTLTNRYTPVAVCGNHTFCKIDGGNTHSGGIDNNGKLWTWGNNNNGQLGINIANVHKSTPIAVLGVNKTFCEIVSGQISVYATDKYGKMWAWGSNANGRLGVYSTANKSTPVAVCGNHTFCKISSGQGHTLGLDSHGKLWGWGYNIYGQVGDFTVTNRCTPIAVCGNHTFCHIDGGNQYTIGIDFRGTAWSWGVNTSGQLGDGSFISKTTPVSIRDNITFCEISCGTSHTIGLDKNNKIWGWGTSIYAGLTVPNLVYGDHTFCKIHAGYSHVLAIDSNNKSWSWGTNAYGHLGDNSVVSKATPVEILGTNKTFCDVKGTVWHSLGLDNNGKVWGWGYNMSGQVGDNTDANCRCTPVAVVGTNKTFCKIAGSGYAHSISIDLRGKIWGWGMNSSGQLGIYSTTDKLTPTAILGVNKTFCKITTGIFQTTGIDFRGKMWGWGYNAQGQLGDNSTTNKSTPVAVYGNKTFCDVSMGHYHSMAVDTNGKIWTWGSDQFGQLGVNSGGTLVSELTPVAILGVNKTFCYISAGQNYCMALDFRGKAWGWGYNGSSVLGDGTTVSKSTPVAVTILFKTFCQISSGQSSVTALDNKNKTWTWGQANGIIPTNTITPKMINI